MELFADPNAWISLATLTVLEIVLGVDNLVFIAIMADRVAVAEQARARQGGIALALVTRLLLLASLAWTIGLTEPLFAVWGRTLSWRDIILIGGGIFLLVKATHEIHDRIEG
jgi:predicted tellurium resistance membrane protein TerC